MKDTLTGFLALQPDIGWIKALKGAVAGALIERDLLGLLPA